jgi:hypothetical protein
MPQIIMNTRLKRYPIFANAVVVAWRYARSVSATVAMERHALGANVVGEEFGVEDDAGDVDTHAVDYEEEVEHGHSSTQRRFIRRFVRIRSHDGCLDD